MVRIFATLIMAAGLTLFGQAVRGPWWSGKTIRELNLSPDQISQMRATLREYRPRLTDQRAAVQKAEQDLENIFGSDSVDSQKAAEVIDRLVAARSDLTRTLSQMGLKLRTVLTLQQWQEVEKRFPPKAGLKRP